MRLFIEFNFFSKRSDLLMMNVTVLVDYMGRNYTTNVLAQRDTDESTIMQMAYEQVRKQWTPIK
jgi:hypothetical protein